jgi:mRNA-degrading endonuclease toxin of MazEF toxin-antitoxin module
VIVAPTSTSSRFRSFRPEIELAEETTRVHIEQLRTVDPRRLGPSYGLVSFAEQQEIDRALLTVLGLDR